MYCPSCGTQMESTVKFCPSCGAPQAQAAPAQTAAAAAEAGALGRLQAQIGAVPVVGTIQQRLNALQVPAVTAGAGGPLAASADLVWSAALAVGALLGIWFMRWFMIPVFLVAGGMALIYGVRPGVSLVTRSILFVVAGAVGDLGLSMSGEFGGAGMLGAMILMAVAGRGVWGLLKEGRPGGAIFPVQGKRWTVLIAGLAICLLATFFQWEADRSYSSINWVRVGTIYKDSSGNVTHDGTWLSPRVNMKVIGGENGGQAVPWLLGAGALLIYFRNRPRPVWVLAALTVCLTFMLISAVQALGSFLGLGVILFFGGFGAVAWSMLAREQS